MGSTGGGVSRDLMGSTGSEVLAIAMGFVRDLWGPTHLYIYDKAHC
jgi:hypothetical protein